MNKTKIDWCDYTWNPVVGCKNGCSYCYAKKIWHRFNPDIPFSRIMNFDERLEEPLKLKKPSRIFVGSMTDLFACWMPKYNVKNILEIVRKCSGCTFLFLTKNPLHYLDYEFPSNCLLGVTIDGTESRDEQLRKVYQLSLNKACNKTFISFEPLLDLPELLIIDFLNIDWVIIGGLTPKPVHDNAWVTKIIERARCRCLPVFLKNNLHYPKRIQEYPK